MVAAPESGAPEYETVIRPGRDPAVPKEDLTASASVITADRTPRSGETLPRLLSELPGAAVTRYGSYGSLSTLSLRGSPPNQVAVYVDGVPLAGALTGTVDLGLVPSTSTQRIEVYRGQSPLPFGSSAMGGIVSITSETPAVSGVQLETGGGSFQTRHAGGSAALVRPGGSLVARLNLFRSQADFPYHSDNGTLFDPRDDQTLRRQNNDLEQIDGSLRGTLAAGSGRQLWLSLSGLQREQGLPARGILQSYATRLARRRLALSANLESTDDLGAGSRLRATVYALGSQQRLRDPMGEITLVNTSTRDHALTAGATSFGSRPVGSGGLVLSALLDARHEGYFPEDLTREAQRLPGRREFGAAAITATQWFQGPQLELLASVRGELAHDLISPEDDVGGQPAAATRPETYLQPIFRLGASQTPHPSLRLRANAGRYARLPTLFERYGNAGNIKGNANLVPESGFNADLGVTWRTPSAEGPERRLLAVIVMDAAVFAADSKNLIHFEQDELLRRVQERGPGAQSGRRAVAGRAGGAGGAPLPQGHGHRRPGSQRRRRPRRPAAAAAAGAARVRPARAARLAARPPLQRPGCTASWRAPAAASRIGPTRRPSRGAPSWAPAPRSPTGPPSCGRCSAPTTSATSWRPTCWISRRRAAPSSSPCSSPIPNRRTIDDYPLD